MLNIDWATNLYSDSSGNGYGYRTHNESLYSEVSKIANITPRAKNRILIRSPEYLNDLNKNKKNWVFSMFEGTTLPPQYVESLSKADRWLVPSTWVKEQFAKYFDNDKIYVVNHGVKPIFTYVKRHFPHKKKFRFLWVGAPNPRKGYPEILLVWSKQGFIMSDNVELYMKTTGPSGWKRGNKVEKRGNVIMDTRNLSTKKLVELYHSSHCFLAPHKGEGFHLCLAEAMATGLPSIATNYSGVTDFFSEDVGYPLGYNMGTGYVTFIGTNDKERTEIAYPKLADLSNQMVYVYENYDKALEKGKKAAARIKNNFTWKKSAETLVDIIKNDK